MDPVRWVPFVVGGVATMAAWLLGAPDWVWLGVLLYAGAWVGGRIGAGALLAAPAVLAWGAPLETVASWQAVAWVAIATSSVAPLFLMLGGRMPWRSWAWPMVALVLGAAWLHPWARLVFASDVAVRAQVLLVAVALLLATGLQRERKR